jgi:hypothetical protein
MESANLGSIFPRANYGAYHSRPNLRVAQRFTAAIHALSADALAAEGDDQKRFVTAHHPRT